MADLSAMLRDISQRVAELQDKYHAVCVERDRLRDAQKLAERVIEERDDARAENERLRALLRQALPVLALFRVESATYQAVKAALQETHVD